MKNQVAKVNTIKPNPSLFNHKGVGRKGFKPLKHKDGTPLSDIEYFQLLAKRAEEIDKENAGSSLPVMYEKYGIDRDTVNIAKQVDRALKEGRPMNEIKDFLGLCIDFDK